MSSTAFNWDRAIAHNNFQEFGDKKVFPEGKERFRLSNRDRDKAVYHTGAKKRRNKKRDT